MPGHHRTKSKEEATGVLTFRQRTWGGGENSDLPASVIAEDEVPLLQDLVAFPGYLEGHSGSQKYSATALPGSGTVHDIKQHPTSKKWLLHRGTKLWYASAAMSSWTEVTSYGSNGTVTINGDTGNQLGGYVYIRGLNASNSNNGTVYWELTSSGGNRTLSVYKDAIKSQLVAQATRAGNGTFFGQQQNSSGLGFYSVLTYSGVDTDAGNTFVGSVSYSFGHDSASTIKPLDKGFVVAAADPGFGTARHPVLVNLTDGKFYNLNNSAPGGYAATPLYGSGSQSSGTPYGTRIIMTFCRIVDSSGVPAYSSNRITATLERESPGNLYKNNAGTDNVVDYGEYWTANPISDSNPLSVNATLGGTVGSDVMLAYAADEHYTHAGIYRVLDIGTNGVDPVTGAGNNREIFIWEGDYDLTAPTFSLTHTDDELRVMYAAGFGLRTRNWREMPAGEVLEVTPGFLYTGIRGENTVSYSQLGAKELAGWYQPGFQFIKLDSPLQAIAKSQNMVTFICSNKCWRSSPSVWKDVGTVGQAVLQLRHLVPVDGPIGVTDWSSLTEVEAGTFIAHCSDHTIRTWDGLSWSKDLASRKVRRILRTAVGYSVGAFVDGAFLFWYRTSSSATYNDKCLRYGFGGDAGHGWARLARSTWVFPPLYAGAVLAFDANGIQRLIVLDDAGGYFYWVETFDSYSGSSLSKIWKDKAATDGSGGTDITPAVTFRERVGSKESNTLRHQETHLQLRPVDESAGYLSGFQVNISGYADGNPTAIESVTNVPKTGDISFWKEHKGHRLQTGLSFTTSKFRIVGIESLDIEDDRKILGQGPFDTDEAGYQRSLGATLKHWLTRYAAKTNRARGSLYTVGGDLPAFVTGPDGRDFALSFTTGQSLSQADTTTYTDFTAVFWVKGITTGNKVFQFAGTTFYVSFPSNTQISINGTTFTVSTIASGWHCFVLTRSGSTVTLYQAGASIGTVTVAGSFGGTSLTLNPDAGAMQLFDFRILTAVLSAAAIAYYYNDVSSNAGAKVIP